MSSTSQLTVGLTRLLHVLSVPSLWYRIALDRFVSRSVPGSFFPCLRSAPSPLVSFFFFFFSTNPIPSFFFLMWSRFLTTAAKAPQVRRRRSALAPATPLLDRQRSPQEPFFPIAILTPFFIHNVYRLPPMQDLSWQLVPSDRTGL